jgi:hypothetical protein
MDLTAFSRTVLIDRLVVLENAAAPPPGAPDAP